MLVIKKTIGVGKNKWQGNLTNMFKFDSCHPQYIWICKEPKFFFSYYIMIIIIIIVKINATMVQTSNCLANGGYNYYS